MSGAGDAGENIGFGAEVRQMMPDLEACLPVGMRGPITTITRIAAGLSGAGVYRVESAGQAYVLKISADDQPLAEWRRRLQVQQAAADAGLAPRILHTDETRRAVLSAFVVDRSFPALYGTPATRDAALTLLGQTIRRVHQIPLPANSEWKDPLILLRTTWSDIAQDFSLPAFVRDAVRSILDEDAPKRDRAMVLSHNDINPTNLAYHGENLTLLDWDTAGPNDPYYDLAAAAVFFRMDDLTCLRLLAVHDDKPVSKIPARFAYNRRLVAILCGVLFLGMALNGGHPGASGDETIDSTLSLVELYQRLRSGALNVATAEGQWLFGLALLKEGVGN